MNDDCLREIISRLGAMDLHSIANSNKRLRALAFELIQRKNKIWTLNFPFDVDAAKALEARKMFAYFGPEIVQMEINFNYQGVSDDHNPNSVQIMEAVVQHCTVIKSLKLQKFHIPDCRASFIGFKSLFKRLDMLHLVNVFIEYDDNSNSIDFFTDCPTLVELRVWESYVLYPAIFQSTFPKLESFIVEEPEKCFDEHTRGFIMRHANLKTFDVDCEEGHINLLAENCKSLEKLGFGIVNRFIQQQQLNSLATFRNLRKLKCAWVGLDMANVMKELLKLTKTLEEVDLSDGQCTVDSLRIISQLKKLHTIRLYDIYIQDTNGTILDVNPQLAKLIVDIVHRLPSLTKLEFYVNSYAIRKETYLQLVNVVGCRPLANRYLLINCRATGDFKSDLRSTVELEYN